MGASHPLVANAAKENQQQAISLTPPLPLFYPLPSSNLSSQLYLSTTSRPSRRSPPRAQSVIKSHPVHTVGHSPHQGSSISAHHCALSHNHAWKLEQPPCNKNQHKSVNNQDQIFQHKQQYSHCSGHPLSGHICNLSVFEKLSPLASFTLATHEKFEDHGEASPIDAH